MKKFLAGLMVLCMLLGTFALAGPQYHMCGKYAYTFLDDGAVELFEYDYSDVTEEFTMVLPTELDGYKVEVVSSLFGSYDDYISHVVIPKGYKKIDHSAFSNANVLKTADIADTVTTIAKECFSDCEFLRQVFIPASVTEIGEGAFLDCPEIILMVEEGSCAEQYAIDNGLKYVS